MVLMTYSIYEHVLGDYIGEENSYSLNHALAGIGAINWGIIGVTNVLGDPVNAVDMVLGSIPVLENTVYLLSGVAGVDVVIDSVSGDHDY